MVCWVTERQEAEGVRKRLQAHADAQVKVHPVKACLARSWQESLSHLLRQEGPVASGSITGGGGNDSSTWGSREWILKRNRVGVPFCNALCTPKAGLC